MAIASSLGASSFLEQATIVNAALHETTNKDLFADAANMASPFYLRWPGDGPSALRDILCLSSALLRLRLGLGRALAASLGHRGFASRHAGIVLGIGNHRERHVETFLHGSAELGIRDDVELVRQHGLHHDFTEIHRVVARRDH